MGWFEVDIPEPEPPPVIEPEPQKDPKTLLDEHIAEILQSTLPMVAMDNTDMTKAKRQEWMEYRKKLQEIPMQPNYPNEVFWPTRPE